MFFQPFLQMGQQLLLIFHWIAESWQKKQNKNSIKKKKLMRPPTEIVVSKIQLRRANLMHMQRAWWRPRESFPGNFIYLDNILLRSIFLFSISGIFYALNNAQLLPFQWAHFVWSWQEVFLFVWIAPWFWQELINYSLLLTGFS